MILRKADAAAAVDAAIAGINEEGGSNTPGKVNIYSGSAPADVATAASGTLLAECSLVDGSVAAFGATNTTTLVATGHTSGGKFAEDTSANNTGTAGYWRLLDYTGAARMQGTIGTSGAEINLTTTSIVSAGTVTITSMNVDGSILS